MRNRSQQGFGIIFILFIIVIAIVLAAAGIILITSLRSGSNQDGSNDAGNSDGAAFTLSDNTRLYKLDDLAKDASQKQISAAVRTYCAGYFSKPGITADKSTVYATSPYKGIFDDATNKQGKFYVSGTSAFIKASCYNTKVEGEQQGDGMVYYLQNRGNTWTADFATAETPAAEQLRQLGYPDDFYPAQ